MKYVAVLLCVMSVLAIFCLTRVEAEDQRAPAPNLECQKLSVVNRNGTEVIRLDAGGIEMLDENGKKAVSIKASTVDRTITVFHKDGKPVFTFKVVNNVSYVEIRSVGNKSSVQCAVTDTGVSLTGQVGDGKPQVVLPKGK